MSLKIGELFIVGFHGTKVPEWLTRFSEAYGLGGVILFDYDFRGKTYENNIESPAQLASLTKTLGALRARPLVVIDQEGGKVRRLKEAKGFAPLPSAQEFAVLPRSQRKLVLETAFIEMRKLGIDWNLAPVVDIDFNPKNPDIGAIGRSFSRTAAGVNENVRLMAEVARRFGVMLCLKHYPGLGGATTNSHLELTRVTEINDSQLALFYELAPHIPGEAVLISHAICPRWDDVNPISMSGKALADLRTHLPTALFVSDDLQMQGLQLKMKTDEAALHGLACGLDQVIIGNNLMDEEAAMETIAARVLQESKTDSALRRRLESAIARVTLRKTKVPHAKVIG